MLTFDQDTARRYMRRCFELATLGKGAVRTNPLVGALLVHKTGIIGEGYHQYYGGPHAEVNAVASVADDKKELIPDSTLFVSLEPCCTYGKTPPCTELILENKVGNVIVSCLDPSPHLQGKSLELLRSKGVSASYGVLEEEGLRLIAPFVTALEQKRPYIILKYAKSSHGIMAPDPPSQHWISDPDMRRLVHKWRSESDGILVGYQTALVDNPSLTNRYYFGSSPLRIILDPKGKLPDSLKVFSDGFSSLRVVNHSVVADGLPGTTVQADNLQELLSKLISLKVGTLLIEGGPATLNRFIQAGLWDEARVITGPGTLSKGLKAPTLPVQPGESYQLGRNLIEIYRAPDLHVR